MALTACSDDSAPSEPGVCWRETMVAGTARYRVVARDIPSLETCAVLLEAARLTGQHDTDGAYQGSFISVDAQRIGASTHRGGYMYPVLQPPQRAQVDQAISKLIKERGGKMPGPDDLVIERQ